MQKQRGVSHRHVYNKKSKIRYSTQRERKSDERYRKEKGVKGRGTLMKFKKQRGLDFCWASQGKTGALVLQ